MGGRWSCGRQREPASRAESAVVSRQSLLDPTPQHRGIGGDPAFTLKF